MRKRAEQWVLTIGTIAMAILVFAPIIGTQIHTFRTQQNSDTFSVSTAVNVTTANVTLSESLLRGHDGLPAEIVSITSTLNETAVPAAYDGLGSKSLAVSNLTANNTRDLTVIYNGQRGGDSDTRMGFLGPFLFFGVFLVIAIGIYKGHKNYKSGGNR